MKIFLRWLGYIWPFWLVQFLVPIAGIKPDADRMIWWYVLVVVFNGFAFVMAWDIQRRKDELAAHVDRLRTLVSLRNDQKNRE